MEERHLWTDSKFGKLVTLAILFGLAYVVYHTALSIGVLPSPDKDKISVGVLAACIIGSIVLSSFDRFLLSMSVIFAMAIFAIGGTLVELLLVAGGFLEWSGFDFNVTSNRWIVVGAALGIAHYAYNWAKWHIITIVRRNRKNHCHASSGSDGCVNGTVQRSDVFSRLATHPIMVLIGIASSVLALVYATVTDFLWR
jgi:hypothetical protein